MENEFDYGEKLKACMEHAGEVLRDLLRKATLEEIEFCAAQDKRAKEVAELEKLMSL